MAAVTNAQILAAINALSDRVFVLEVEADKPAPVKAAPAKAKAASPAFGDRTFDEYVAARVASRVPCAIDAHAGICNREFSPKSSGVTSHVARIV